MTRADGRPSRLAVARIIALGRRLPMVKTVSYHAPNSTMGSALIRASFRPRRPGTTLSFRRARNRRGIELGTGARAGPGAQQVLLVGMAARPRGDVGAARDDLQPLAARVGESRADDFAREPLPAPGRRDERVMEIESVAAAGVLEDGLLTAAETEDEPPRGFVVLDTRSRGVRHPGHSGVPHPGRQLSLTRPPLPCRPLS